MSADSEICGYALGRRHKRKHQRFLEISEKYAVPKFGPLLWLCDEREANKSAERRASYYGGPYDGERHMYAWFCRSVLCWRKNPFSHPAFEDYAAMIIEGGLPRDEAVRLELAKRYPRRPGNRTYIEPGYSIWRGEAAA